MNKPPKFDIDADASPRWFIHVHLPIAGKLGGYWALHRPIPGTPFEEMAFNECAMFAEAFTRENAEKFMQLIPATYRGAECLAIACNSAQLLPDHLRRVINV